MLKLGDNSFIVEKIENGIAVLEKNGEMIEVSASLLPKGAKEGDILRLEGSQYIADTEATAARRKELFAKQQSLFKR